MRTEGFFLCKKYRKEVIKLNKARAELEASFLSDLESGQIPWEHLCTTGRPFNATSGKTYRGVNAIILANTAAKKHFTDPRWCTFSQAQKNGWKIKAGDHGTPIEYWGYYDKTQKKNISFNEACELKKELPEKEYKARVTLMSNVYHLYNAEQLEGIPKYISPDKPTPTNLSNHIDTLISNISMDVDLNEEVESKLVIEASEDFNSFLQKACSLAKYSSSVNICPGGSFNPMAKNVIREKMALAFLAMDLGTDCVIPKSHVDFNPVWQKMIQKKNELFKIIKDAENMSNYILEKGEFKVIEPEKTLTDSEHSKAKITFYVAECMEFTHLGEYHEGLTLDEAIKAYHKIPSSRMNAIKGIGFKINEKGTTPDNTPWYNDMPFDLITRDSLSSAFDPDLANSVYKDIVNHPLVKDAVEKIHRDGTILKEDIVKKMDKDENAKQHERQVVYKKTR